MKKLFVLSMCAAAALAVLPARAADDVPWFDMEKCGMCSALLEPEGMLQHMTWDHYPFATGMITVTTIEPDYADAYATACKKMEDTGAKLAQGEQMYLCGHCTSYGMLMMSGAKLESFETEAGEVTTMSSTDPDVIAKIHAHLEKTQEAMEAAEGSEG
ncbi:MAG: hypothetical protein GF346_01320 [Candidatus Eisenbacteria bacterium]|nr:hypothetical protein [Candidatus Latescibacterota bacterium]MBD3301070.1 hypothetical protein [Candidatus Eisenbacteria bacterium]